MPDQEHFISLRPKAATLQAFIAYYYFHQSDRPGHTSRFIYYPNTRNALTIYKQSAVHYTHCHSIAAPTETTWNAYYSGVQSQFCLAEIVAPFDKIGIVFQPLGINQFITAPLRKLLSPTLDKSFNHFQESMESTLIKVDQSDSFDEKVEHLDAYFLSRDQAFKASKLEDALSTLQEAEDKISVNALAGAACISRRTLLRLFQTHLCCSVKDYIKVVQFRKALDAYQAAEDKPRLTHLAHSMGYYDQSELIHHFKTITGINPKQFFRDIDHLGEEDTFWNLIS